MKTAPLMALACIAASANAAVLVSDSFNYANGNLIGNGAWAAHSGAGSNPVQVSAGTIVLSQGSGSREDVNLAAGAILGVGETWYAGFDMKSSGGTASVYFAHFIQGTSGFDARVFVTAPTAGGNYTVGFSSSSTIAATWATDLNFGEWNRIIISYSRGTGEARLWINPVNQASTNLMYTSPFANTAMEGIAFRQAAGDSTQMIDNVILGTTFADVVPTPGPAAIMALAGLSIVRRQR